MHQTPIDSSTNTNILLTWKKTDIRSNLAATHWKKEEASFGLQLGQEKHPRLRRFWWVLRSSPGLPPSISGSNCLCWWIWSSVSITEPSDRLHLDGGHAGEQNSWINWQINLYIQCPLGSSLSACKPLRPSLALIAGAHMNHWCAHLILSPSFSEREREQRQPRPQSSLFCVRSGVSVIDNGVIFSLWGRKMKAGEVRVNNVIH